MMDAGASGDLRERTRTPTRLRVTAIIEAYGILQGYVRDISINGASLYVEHNLHIHKSIELQLIIPPQVVNEPPRVVVVAGKIVYSVYESYELGFRAGIHFLKFNNEADIAYLQSRIV